jgi:hypothetical protein
LPPVSDQSFTGQQGILFNPILVSKNDVFNFSHGIKSSLNTNFATIVSAGVLLEGVNGIRYRLTYLINTNGRPIYLWNTTTETPTTVTTSSMQFGQRGQVDNSEYDTVSLVPATGDRADVDMRRFPVDGVLWIKIGGYKNNQSGYADIESRINDIDFEYQFFVNESTLIEAQQHTASTPIDSLNIEEKDIKADDCVKYSAAGAFYDVNNANTVVWERFEDDPEPGAISEINTTDQLTTQGEGRRVIAGNFEGVMDFNQFVSFDGQRFAPTRLSIDLHRQQVEGEFTELAANPNISYKFEYLYKANN